MDWAALRLPAGWKQTGREWHGPCPVTGEGKDRAWVRPEEERLGCRGCGPDGDGGLGSGELLKAHAEALGIWTAPRGRPAGSSWGRPSTSRTAPAGRPGSRSPGRRSGACGVGSAGAGVGLGRRGHRDTGGALPPLYRAYLAVSAVLDFAARDGHGITREIGRFARCPSLPVSSRKRGRAGTARSGTAGAVPFGRPGGEIPAGARRSGLARRNRAGGGPRRGDSRPGGGGRRSVTARPWRSVTRRP